MRVDLCSDLLQATRKVATTKYQGIFVDYSNEVSACALINGVRGSTSNSADVVYAFVNDATQAVEARRLGANFVIPQPFTTEAIAPFIRAGHGLMIHELRRYFRAPVVFAVDLIAQEGRRLRARSIDLSSGGLAVLLDQSLMPGQSFAASFQIPGSGEAVDVAVTVCWTDNAGRAGLRFEMPSQLAQAAIERWLRAEIDRKLCLGLSS